MHKGDEIHLETDSEPAPAGDPFVKQAGAPAQSRRWAIKLAIGFVLATIGFQAVRSLSWIFAPSASVTTDHNVTVRREPSALTVHYVDGTDWPQDPKDGHTFKAYTYWSYISRTDFDLELQKGPSKDGVYVFQVKRAAIDLTLPMTMWFPFSVVSDKLRKHEDGHCKLCDKVYGSASQCAVESAKKLFGQAIAIRASSLEQAKTAAARRAHTLFDSYYRVGTEDVAHTVSDIYDEITNHGRNDVSTESGMAMALKEYAKKHPALP